MQSFVTQNTARLIALGNEEGSYGAESRNTALSIWAKARKARPELTGNKKHNGGAQMEEYNTDPNEAVARVNAERNEMVALLQSAKGAKFVTVVAQPSSMNVTLSHESRMKGGVKYTYKAVDLDLKAGDFVLVQFRGRLGIGMVIEVLGEPPTSNEYDWTIEMKHVIQKLDIDRSRQLAQLDKNMLKTITNSEAQDRLERLTRQLGIAMDKITLELPPIEDSQVIEY